MKTRHFLGGLIIILIGLILLANNFGILSWGIWYHLIRLWPLILIAVGLDLILKTVSLPYLRILPPLLIIAVICLVICLYHSQGNRFYYFFGKNTQSIELSQPLLPSIKKANINLRFKAGKLKIREGSTKNLASGNFTIPLEIMPWMKYRELNGEGFLEIGEKEKEREYLFTRWNRAHFWDIKLNSTIPLSLKISAGASDNDLNLSSLKIVEFDLDVGASNSRIRFGNITSIKARVSGGASKIKILIPHSMGVKIRTDAGLTSNNLDALGFKKSENIYLSNNYPTAEKQLKLDLDADASALKLELY